MRMRLMLKTIRFNTLILLIVCFAVSIAKAQTADENDGIQRHPLEIEALTEPQTVLNKLPPLITMASQQDNFLELTLLYLAQSNACRVIADWNCQIQAGIQASENAVRANNPLLQVRGLISKGRGQMALQAYGSSEETMGEAERLLALHPSRPLFADVMLAYSSLSYNLNKIDLSEDYARRGISALGTLVAPSIRVRLLRNQARALSKLQRNNEALGFLNGALVLSNALNDPKLSAELSLEAARISGELGDVEKQIASGTNIIGLGERLNNGQLKGLGYEVLGQAALSTGDWRLGENHLMKAQSHFRSLKLSRDERRASRLLLNSMLNRNPDISELKSQSKRLIELEKLLEIDDKKLISDSINAQQQYAQQKYDLRKLKDDAEISKAREIEASTRQRATYIIAGLSILSLIILGILSVTQRRNAKKLQQTHRQLLASESRLRDIADNIPAHIAQFDNQCRYQFVNEHICEKYQLDSHTILGKTIRELRGDVIADKIGPYIELVLQGQRQSFETDDGNTRQKQYFQCNYIPITGADNAVKGFYSLAFDITALKNAQFQLNQLSRTDSLTGTANRRHFEEALTHALARGRRDNHACALLCLDIDHFKPINDEYGHLAGDAVIVEFSKRMQACLREVDLLARIGGDEFVILMENAPPGSAEVVCEKIVAAMQKPYTVNGESLEVTVSAGSAYSKHTYSSEDLFRQADQALYKAKQSGRNQYIAAIA